MIKLKGAKTTTYIHDQEIITVNSGLIDQIKKAALKDPLGRARLCLHRRNEDAVQEMIIVMRKGTYVRPHRHVAKTESFHLIEGKLLLVFFSDTGKVIRQMIMSRNNKRIPFIYRLSSDIYHTVIPISDLIILHETTTGPFSKTNSEFAPWSPEETDKINIKKYLTKILKRD